MCGLDILEVSVRSKQARTHTGRKEATGRHRETHISGIPYVQTCPDASNIQGGDFDRGRNQTVSRSMTFTVHQTRAVVEGCGRPTISGKRCQGLAVNVPMVTEHHGCRTPTKFMEITRHKQKLVSCVQSQASYLSC